MKALRRRLHRRTTGVARLDRALAQLQGDIAIERRGPLYEALLRCKLAVMTAGDPGPVLPDGRHGDVTLQATVNADGDLIFPVFTNPEAMRAWNADLAGAVLIDAKDVFPHFLETDAVALVVNPGTATGAALTRSEVSVLAEGRVPTGGDDELLQVPALTGEVELGRADLNALPADFVPALRAACAEVAGVDTAYVFQLTPEDGRPRQFVGLRLADDCDPHTIARAIGHRLSTHLTEPFHADFDFLSNEMEAYVRQVTAAVFER